MTANVKEGKLIYLMKISRFFFVCLFNLASDQLLILSLLTRASNWHFILFITCFFPLMILVNLRHFYFRPATKVSLCMQERKTDPSLKKHLLIGNFFGSD